MNKVLAEIIAGIIPNKVERTRWRGVLRYGLWNAIKMKHQMKKGMVFCLSLQLVELVQAFII